jgi:photosystem II stability/assembly factor-like uncharacterized protein
LSLWWLLAALGTDVSFAQSGWYEQSPLPTGHNLASVASPDSSTIVAVGMNGTIVRSTDGGDTWPRPASGTSQSLYRVSFADANTGGAVGNGGTILRTLDGGETWT